MRHFWSFVLVCSAVVLMGADKPPAKAKQKSAGKRSAASKKAGGKAPTAKEKSAGQPAVEHPGLSLVDETARGRSRLVVRCLEDCTVKVDGKPGTRQDSKQWEFEDVEPGQRQVEATGKVLFVDRPLFGGFLEVPAGVRALALVDSRNRITLTDTQPLQGGPKEAKAEAKAGAETSPHKGSLSVLNVRCQKPCTVEVDQIRRSASSTQNVVVPDLEPGAHEVYVRFALGGKGGRDTLTLPPSSEVYVYATEGNLKVTNTLPLKAAQE